MIDLRDDTTKIETKYGPVFKCIIILLFERNFVLQTCLHTDVCNIIIDVLKWRAFRLFERNSISLRHLNEKTSHFVHLASNYLLSDLVIMSMRVGLPPIHKTIVGLGSRPSSRSTKDILTHPNFIREKDKNKLSGLLWSSLSSVITCSNWCFLTYYWDWFFFT